MKLQNNGESYRKCACAYSSFARDCHTNVYGLGNTFQPSTVSPFMGLKMQPWTACTSRPKSKTHETLSYTLEVLVFNLNRLSRSALVTTETELSAIAAPANTGVSSGPPKA